MLRKNHIVHLTQDLTLTTNDVARRMFGVEPSGVGQSCSNQSRLSAGELLRCRMEMVPGNRFGPINAVAGLHGIQIYFQNSVLTPEHFYQHREVDFQTLSVPGGTRPQKNILGRLLTDRAGASGFFPILVLPDSLLNLFRIKTPMFEKTLIFGSDDSPFQIVRDVAAGFPVMVPHQLFSAEQLSKRSNDHQRCHNDRNETVNDDNQ